MTSRRRRPTGGQVLHLYTWLIVGWLTLPVLVMIVFGFNDTRGRYNQTWEGFTLIWYARVFDRDGLTWALLVSLAVAGVTMLVAGVLGTGIGYALGRYTFRGSGAVDLVMFATMSSPELVMGASLLTLFVSLGVGLGAVTITIAHIMFSLSFVAVVVRARVLTLDRSVEEAAADLGAGPLTTFWRITFPAIRPAVFAGMMLAAALSIDDFVVTNFTAGTTVTFPLWIWGATRLGLPPQVNVMGTLIFAVGVLIAVASSVRTRPPAATLFRVKGHGRLAGDDRAVVMVARAGVVGAGTIEVTPLFRRLMRGWRAVVPRTTARDRGSSATAVLLLLVLLTGALAGCDASEPDRPDSGSPTGGPGATTGGAGAPGGPAGDPATGVRVSGNRLVDFAGRTVRLRGFNHAGAEYACVDGGGLFDTPDGAAPGDAVVAAMKSWGGANTVRVPLNEQCWLGLPSVSARYAGTAYRTAIGTFVDRLQAHGMVAILDLHRSAPAGGVSKQQEQLPDRDHSLDFWTGVATTFRNRGAVVFDLFNEPYPFAETNSDRAWACWRDGGCRLTSVNTGQPYVAAGMTELIAAVRATGARNVVLAGGIHWAESLTRWLAHRPADPLGQLAAAFHAYSFNDYCVDVACYDRDLAPVAAAVPLVVGEIGPALSRGAGGIDEDCPSAAVQAGGTFADTMLDWADEHGSGYTPWSWNPWDDCWSLVTDWAGTPSPLWGAQVRRRLARSG